MEQKDCHAVAAFKTPTARLYSSIFEHGYSCPTRHTTLLSKLSPDTSLDTSTGLEFSSNFDHIFNTQVTTPKPSTLVSPENSTLSLKFEEHINKPWAQEWRDTLKLQHATVPSVVPQMQRGIPVTRIPCPYLSTFEASMEERENTTQEINLQFDFLSLQYVTDRNTTKSASNFKCPYVHTSYRDWVDIYFASIEPLLDKADYKWIHDSKSLSQKRWTHKECFSNGGFGYSSTAMETFGTKESNTSAPETQKLALFCNFYNEGNEEAALEALFSHQIGHTFADLLDSISKEVPECAFEPPIISLAALLYNEGYNHECFQAIFFYLSSEFPSLIMDDSESPIHSLISQVIKIVQHPMDGETFCSVQKCFSLLFLMIGKPLLALDCLLAGKSASQTMDPILLSRICALFRIILLNADGTNPLFRDLSKNDFDSIWVIWDAIRSHMEFNLASEQCKSFASASVNFNLLLRIEQELRDHQNNSN